MLALKQSAK